MNKTIVYCSNGGDAKLLRASLFSVRKFVPEADIFILSDNLTQEDFPTETIIDPAPILTDLGFFSDRWARKWPYATLYRLAIPLIPELASRERVLYLDTDTLAFSSEINELFECPLGQAEVLGVKDYNGTYTRIEKCIFRDLHPSDSLEIIQHIWKEQSISKQDYVNAGVTVWCPSQININGTDWYKQRLKWFWKAELQGKFDYLDQDFINAMMIANRTLPSKYNSYPQLNDPHAVIKHFIGDEKQQMIASAYTLGYEDRVLTGAGSTDEKIVVYASDGNDAPMLRASMNTAKKYLGPKTKFFILTTKDSYPECPEAVLVNPAPMLAMLGLNEKNHKSKWPYSTLFRLVIPLLPEFNQYENILYLDTDTLIRSSDASQLYSLPADEFEVYGISDIEARQWNIENIVTTIVPSEARTLLHEKIWNRRNIITRSYINAGVIVICLKAIRNNGLDWYKTRLMWGAGLLEQRKLRFLDQDFINVFLDVSPSIAVRYNHFGGDHTTNCVVQHFVGGSKSGMLPTARKIGVISDET